MKTAEKIIEVEYRALLTPEQHGKLTTFLDKNAESLGEDNKRIWFFIMPDKLLKVTHNISQQSAKVTLKLNRIGQGSSFEEVEYPIAEKDVETAVRLFQSLGHEYLLEPTVLRHNYLYKGVELALKYSKSWGYHLELEIVVNDPEQKTAAEEQIHQVAKELGVTIMTEEELTTFDQGIQDNYTHPEEAAL